MAPQPKDDLDLLAEDIFSEEPGKERTATLERPVDPPAESPTQSAATTSPAPTSTPKKPSKSSEFDTSDFDLDDETDHPGCQQCGSTESWGLASWCPDCGYYPATGQKPDGQSEAVSSLGAPASRNLENWWEVVPNWGWTLMGGAKAIVIVGLIVRLSIPVENPRRFWIALGMLVIGLICAGTAHFLSYMFAVMKDTTLAPWDLFLKPVAIWKRTVKDLFSASPSDGAKKRALVGGWGLAATLTAMVVIGFNYNALFEKDWASEGADTNVVQAIVAEARKQEAEANGNGDGDLEGSMNDFVGEETEDELKPTHQTDCLVVGYSMTDDGALDMVHLASVRKNKLKFVGSLPGDEIPKQERIDLVRRFGKLESSQGLVEVPASDATFLRPVIMMRIGHFNWSSGKMKQPQFDSLLRDVD